MPHSVLVPTVHDDVHAANSIRIKPKPQLSHWRRIGNRTHFPFVFLKFRLDLKVCQGFKSKFAFFFFPAAVGSVPTTTLPTRATYSTHKCTFYCSKWRYYCLHMNPYRGQISQHFQHASYGMYGTSLRTYVHVSTKVLYMLHRSPPFIICC